MTEINYKNKLQELCQKSKQQLPRYTVYSNGPAHITKWIADVTVCGKKFHTTKSHDKLILAEQEAACIAYNYLQSKATTTPIQSTTTNSQPQPITQQLQPTTPRQFTTPINQQQQSEEILFIPKNLKVVFVDLENIKMTAPIELPNYVFYGFHSTYSTVSLDKVPSHIISIVIDSPHSEATDHSMTFHASRISLKYSKSDTNFIILSRDKSSAILTHLLKTEGYNVVHYKSEIEFLHHIEK